MSTYPNFIRTRRRKWWLPFRKHKQDNWKSMISSQNLNSQKTKLDLNYLKVISIFVLCAFFIVFILGTRIIINGRNKLDKYLCPQGEILYHTIFAVDITDPLTNAQYRAFLDELSRYRDALNKGHRFSLWAIQSEIPTQAAQGVQLFSKCVPPDGSNVNPLIETKKKLRIRFEEQFNNPLNKAVEAIDPNRKAINSPILGTLRKIGLMPSFKNAISKEIILFSNLLENTAQVSHYKPLIGFNKLLKLNLRVLDVKNLFSGTSITVFLIPDNRHTAELKNWWKQYFSYAGAVRFEIKRL